MDDRDVSRRLKAARWIAGSQDEKGRVTPMTPEDLAQKRELAENGLTANAITEFERLIRPARPMELRAITAALDLPADWFEPSADEAIAADNASRLDQVTEQLEELRSILHESTDKVLVARVEIQTRVLQRLEQIDGRVVEIDRKLDQLTQLDGTTVVPLVRRALESVADETRAPEGPPPSPPQRRQGSPRARNRSAADSDPDEPRR